MQLSFVMNNFACMTFHVAPSHLIKIIHEHLTHLIDRNGCINSAVQTQFSHSIWQGPQVYGVRMGEEHSIDLVNISEENK